MPVDGGLLASYREKLNLELDKLSEEITMARYRAKQAEAEAYVIAKIDPDDLAVARGRDVFGPADGGAAQAALDALIIQRDALRRILLETKVT